MDNKKKLVLAAPVPLDRVESKLNWSLCCFCQKSGELVCPAKNPNLSMRNVGYKTVAANLETLKLYHHVLPCGRNVREYDNGDGILNSLIQHEAKWHKKCLINYTTRFSTDGLEKLEVPEQVPDTSSVSTARQTRSAYVSLNPKEDICFLCCKPSQNKNIPLHRCMTYEVNDSVKEYATRANDTRLLAFLGEGDLVAQEAKYHRTCMLGLYSKGLSSGTSKEKGKVICEGLAFADLILYMNAELQHTEMKCAFNTATLKKLYINRLSQLLGTEYDGEVHSQRFREKILLHFPELQAIKSGREYVLTVKDVNILNNIHVSHEDLDALAVNRFIKNIRIHVLNTEVSFKGHFEEKCGENVIPSALLALVNMLLYGSAISSQCRATNPALTISQLIMANMSSSKPKGDIVRHKKLQMPPLPMYIGLSTYGESRDKKKIDELHEMGISVSSDRVYNVTANLARMVVNRAAEEGVVCPSILKKGIFTVAALDNIDHKPSSKTSVGEFHGTGISLFQLPIKGEAFETRSFQTQYSDESDSRAVPNLPEEYSEIPEFSFRNTQPSCPICSSDVKEKLLNQTGSSNDIWHEEKDWLDHIHKVLLDSEFAISAVSWAAFRANRAEVCPLARSPNSLLPLFEEKSTSPAMIKHGMDLIRMTTNHLNPGQIPIICVDQPLFAIAKLLQWTLPETYGETQYVVLFGPLHIEQNYLRVLGQLMEGSGWVGIVGTSGVLPSGSAEGLLKVSSITKARSFHQYTAAVLHSLLADAYLEDNPDQNVSLEDWIHDREARSPMFKYWLLVLRLELLLLEFVRSVREGNFELFKKSILSMLPWFFSVNHHHYARWLTVHAIDLLNLESMVPDVHRRFSLGSFVVRKTENAFSCLGVDHAHEQNNSDIKSKGGAIGLTQDATALRRWTLAGPEVSRLLSEFNKAKGRSEGVHLHNEQYPRFQKNFIANCAAIKDSFIQNENPFLFKGEKLIVLDTRVEIAEGGIQALNKIERCGTDMLETFVSERLVSQKTSFYAPIKKSKFEVFAHKKTGEVSQVGQLKTDVQLFSRLFIVSMARSLDLDEFFAHENQQCPPSISVNGKLRSGPKHELVPILEKLVGEYGQPDSCDGLVFDGAALVRMIKPTPDTLTFEQFSSQINNYVSGLAVKMKTRNVALVWDQYHDNSLKNCTREARGTGTRRPDLPEKGAFPKQAKQWDDYLKNALNKQELFPFLARNALNISNLLIVTNIGDTIYGTQSETKGTALHNVSCAEMEEADGRLILHVRDMVQHGCQRVVIRCADTDILILAVSFYHSLHSLGLSELWILYGTGARRRFIPAHAIAENLGPDKACALRGLFAFTGCDQVSFFASKGKRSAWAAWKYDNDFTEAFKRLAAPEVDKPSDEIMKTLERYVVRLYGGEGQCEGVNAARKELFATQGKPIGLIPPTQEALRLHTLRAAYQAGQVWGRADTVYRNIPSPDQWGWKMTSSGWQPLWINQDSIWQTCRELSLCGCSSDCSTRRCSCVRAGVPCALSCKKCRGACQNSKKNDSQADDNEDETVML